jgi:hypothetical protein
MLPSEKVGLLKIDVEGYELRVLKGSRALIQRPRPLLHVENDRVEHSQELIEWIGEAGHNAGLILSITALPMNRQL